MNGSQVEGLLKRLDEAHKEEKQFELETFGAREYDPEGDTLHSEAAEAIRELSTEIDNLRSSL